MKVRVLFALASGRLDPDLWAQAAREEAPVHGQPRGCADCPLRPGGVCEAGARETLPAVSARTRQRLKDWGCHTGDRPCAGMRRLLTATAGSKETSR